MIAAKSIKVITFGSSTVRNGGAFLTSRIISTMAAVNGAEISTVRIGGLRSRAAGKPGAVASAVLEGFRNGIDPRVGIDVGRIMDDLARAPLDIVVLDSTLLGGLAAPIRKLMPTAKIVSVAHNNEYRYAQLGVRLGSLSKLPYLQIARKAEDLAVKGSDYIVTFSARNFNYFAQQDPCPGKVIRWYAPMAISKKKESDTEPEFDFAIAASRNVFNREPLAAAIRFVNEARKYRLVIGGNVAHGLRGSQYVTPYGFFDEPDQFYAMANATLNLMRFGEGIKIKTIESLELGVPVIGFREAFEGIEVDDFPGLCYVIENPEEIDQAYAAAKAVRPARLPVGSLHSETKFASDVKQLLESCAK
jgi:glycosyltransferase involved in cell wall biosynthesis